MNDRIYTVADGTAAAGTVVYLSALGRVKEVTIKGDARMWRDGKHVACRDDREHEIASLYVKFAGARRAAIEFHLAAIAKAERDLRSARCAIEKLWEMDAAAVAPVKRPRHAAPAAERGCDA